MTGGVVVLVIILIAGRSIWPYLDVHDPSVVDGWSVETVTEDLGGPTCLIWQDADHLLVCDRDGDRIHRLTMTLGDGGWEVEQRSSWLEDVDDPHGLVILDDAVVISERGRLRSFPLFDGAPDPAAARVLVEGIPDGNHQTNAVNLLPNGTLVWHSGSTCNVCEEEDPRNAALLWVNATSGDHGVLASGVRNSFDGVWVDGMGYLFSDNGRDWEGDHPPEEVNLLIEGADYGWPNDAPETPIPEGTEAPVATWTPHSSVNGLTWRPPTSSLPGGDMTVYATVYGSWNSIVPVGHEILRIDFRSEGNGTWTSETTTFASDLGTPLPIVFHPDGDLFYATFNGDGRLHVIRSS